MRTPDVAHYLDEISRVLAPGGRCYATFFLMTPESRAAVAAGRANLDFRHELDGYFTTSLKTRSARSRTTRPGSGSSTRERGSASSSRSVTAPGSPMARDRTWSCRARASQAR
jgi:hypothetical protein